MFFSYGFSSSIDVGERSSVGRSLMMAACPPIALADPGRTSDVYLSSLAQTTQIANLGSTSTNGNASGDTKPVRFVVGIERIQGPQPL